MASYQQVNKKASHLRGFFVSTIDIDKQKPCRSIEITLFSLTFG